MDVTGVIIGAKVVKGIAQIIIDTFEEGAGKKRRKKVIKKPLGRNMTEQDVLKFIGEGVVKITILGGMIDNIWPE